MRFFDANLKHVENVQETPPAAEEPNVESVALDEVVVIH